MLFNSYIFILLFLPLCLAGYWLCNAGRRYDWGKIWLVGMSLWFYGYFNIRYLPLIVLSVFGNYYLYRLLVWQSFGGTGSGNDGQTITDRQAAGRQQPRKLILAAGVSANLGVLFYYKYFDFFIENVNTVFHVDLALQHVLLPLGISFFTFQQVGFLVDAYRGEVEECGFLEYSLFVTFFPQLIAGPIVTHSEMISQFRDQSKKRFDADNMAKGCYAFVCGLAKKVLVADIFGKAVAWGFGNLEQMNGLASLWMMISYMVQLYFDFSGYCDMARGIGLMFNIDIPLNFNSPYKAVNLVDFWKRWHITLNRFFTQYVYIPLGGNRKGVVRTYFNIFMIYLVSGIWHGAGWTFILWGAMHGVVYVLTRRFLTSVEKLPQLLTWFGNMVFFLISLVFFRAESVPQALTILHRIFAGGYALSAVPAAFVEQFKSPEFFYCLKALGIDGVTVAPRLLMVGYMAAAWFMLLGCKNVNEKLQTFRPTFLKAVAVAVLFLWSLVSFSEVSTFLYFNF